MAADDESGRTVDAERSAKIEVVGQNFGDARVVHAFLDLFAVEANVGQQIAGLRDELKGDVSGLTERLDSVSSEVEKQASDPGLAAAVAATALKSAIDRGGSFAAELETLAAVKPDLPAIAALRDYAGSGVATRDDLAVQFETAAQAMIAASETPDPSAGVFDRLMSSARGLVKVRPVGDVEGDGVAAIVARMGAALKAGNADGVTAAYDSLPEASKQAGTAFMASYKARLEADRLIAEALKAASGTGG